MTSFAPLALRLVQPEWTTEVPSPAHDALTAAGRRRHLEEHPFSYLRVTRSPEDLAPEDRPVTRSELAVQGRAALDDLIECGAFGPVQPPRFHAYELHQQDAAGRSIHCQIGIVGGIPIGDYGAGKLRRHERIREDRARHLAEHLDVVGYQSSPVAVAFRPIPAVQQVLDAARETTPAVSIVGDDGLTQNIWPLADAGIGAMLVDEPTYLIDGHHRAAAAERYFDGQGHPPWLLAALFATDQLHNHSFHRQLRGLALADVLERIGERLAVRPLTGPDGCRPDELPLWGLVEGTERWVAVKLPFAPATGPGDEVANLDPTRLEAQLLAPILQIDVSDESAPVHYRPGTLGLPALQEEARSTGSTLCVTRTVPIETILAAADAGLVLPPKSTYFEPKVRSGVFLRPIR